VNGYNEPKAVVENFIREKSLKQKVLLMGKDMGVREYGVTAFPTSFLIDPQGKVVERFLGFDGPKTEEKVRNLLARQTTESATKKE
jgi:peroxiredoxin